MSDFTAVVDFYSDETKSQYTAGLSYTARDPARYFDAEGKPTPASARATKLQEMIPQWLAEGKIKPGRPPAAEVTGEG